MASIVPERNARKTLNAIPLVILRKDSSLTTPSRLPFVHEAEGMRILVGGWRRAPGRSADDEYFRRAHQHHHLQLRGTSIDVTLGTGSGCRSGEKTGRDDANLPRVVSLFTSVISNLRGHHPGSRRSLPPEAHTDGSDFASHPWIRISTPGPPDNRLRADLDHTPARACATKDGVASVSTPDSPIRHRVHVPAQALICGASKHLKLTSCSVIAISQGRCDPQFILLRPPTRALAIVLTCCFFRTSPDRIAPCRMSQRKAL
nr:hypothetical protein CFP56_38884 [Quercus suber]